MYSGQQIPGYIWFIWLAMMWGAIGLYFLPSIIAAIRRHPNTLQIIVMNLLTGWTFYGWVVAILWSLQRIIRPEPPALPRQ